MAMEIEWQDHTIEIRGDWTIRWLYLSPTYELYFDGERVDTAGGPFPRPRLQAEYRGEDGISHQIEAELLSIFGVRPYCEVDIDGDAVGEGNVHVENVLNPLLMLFILAGTAVMIYLGPSVLRAYLPVQ
jgi:hypothetical protein